MRKFNAIILALALGFLILFIYKLGPSLILAGVRHVGAGFFLLLGIFVSCFCLQVWNWRRCFLAPPSYRSMLLAGWCGESINFLTPTSNIGELVKIELLSKHIEVETVVSGLLLYSIAYVGAMALFIFIGFACLWFIGSVPLWFSLVGSLFALLLVGILTLFYWGVAKNFFSKLLAQLCQRYNLCKLARAISHVEKCEQEITSFSQRCPGRLPQVFALAFITHCFPAIEMWTGWWLLGIKLNLAYCLIFTSVDFIVRFLFMFIPANLGAAEGTQYYASSFLNLDPIAGLTRQLLARFVRMVFAFAGGLVFAWMTWRRPNELQQSPHTSE